MSFFPLNPEAIRFIQDNERTDVSSLILKHKTICGLPAKFIADQILARRKAKEKLPALYANQNIVFPQLLNLEQTSSEETANFKADLVKQILPKTETAVDLTGGFGVDTLAFQKLFHHIDFVEPNIELLEVVKLNHRHVGVSNITYHPDRAEDFLERHKTHVDLIYIDPSRRVDNKKVSTLRDSLPDVVELKALLLERCDLLLIKAAPLLDIKGALRELTNVTKVVVVSAKNDCKEILFCCKKGFEGEAQITAVNLGSGQIDFSFTYSEEISSEPGSGELKRYLYEPNASVLKAAAFKTVAVRFQLSKLHPNTHLYTSPSLVDNFPGRVFEVLQEIKLEKKLTDALYRDGKVNVLTRNYPLTPDEIKKKLRLVDGGDAYLIAFTGKTKLIVDAKRVM